MSVLQNESILQTFILRQFMQPKTNLIKKLDFSLKIRDFPLFLSCPGFNSIPTNILSSNTSPLGESIISSIYCRDLLHISWFCCFIPYKPHCLNALECTYFWISWISSHLTAISIPVPKSKIRILSQNAKTGGPVTHCQFSSKETAAARWRKKISRQLCKPSSYQFQNLTVSLFQLYVMEDFNELLQWFRGFSHCIYCCEISHFMMLLPAAIMS